MSKTKMHLAIRGRAACGHPQAARFTGTPRLVTCEGCKLSVHMADAEVREAAQPRQQEGRS